jgi:hypothetical protein
VSYKYNDRKIKMKEVAVAYFGVYCHHLTAEIERKISINPNKGVQE